MPSRLCWTWCCPHSDCCTVTGPTGVPLREPSPPEASRWGRRGDGWEGPTWRTTGTKARGLQCEVSTSSALGSGCAFRLSMGNFRWVRWATFTGPEAAPGRSCGLGPGFPTRAPTEPGVCIWIWLPFSRWAASGPTIQWAVPLPPRRGRPLSGSARACTSTRGSWTLRAGTRPWPLHPAPRP